MGRRQWAGHPLATVFDLQEAMGLWGRGSLGPSGQSGKLWRAMPALPSDAGSAQGLAIR